MQVQATTVGEQPPVDVDGALAQQRSDRRAKTLQAALRKRAAGVPTYTVPEAAALLSVSQEHLYRQIRSDAFPAVDLRGRRDRGRYVVPARAVEALLDAATGTGALVEAASCCPTGGMA
jgi:excisionase family DNA binding protein